MTNGDLRHGDSKAEARILRSAEATPLGFPHRIRKTPGPGFPSLSCLLPVLGFHEILTPILPHVTAPPHPLIFWVQLWYRLTPYILQKQMGSRGNREGGQSLSKCSYSRFRSSVLFQSMVPWWVVNLSWQNGSNKTNQLYVTFKLKGLVILGEIGFLLYKCVSNHRFPKERRSY